MPVFNFELTRTYSTHFEIKAKNQKQAYKKFQSLGEEMYAQELEQCNIEEESVKGDKYARCCTCCGEGMNQGYFANYEYFCSDSCLRTEYSSLHWENLCKESEDNGDNEYYWTKWEDENDYQYQIIDGKLQQIN